MSQTPPYPYPITNSELIKTHKLVPHFEGGYFSETVVLNSQPSSSKTASSGPVTSAPAQDRHQSASGRGTDWFSDEPATSRVPEGDDVQTDATLIYYLITPESYRSKMFTNNFSSFHLHHAGRSLYTLIKPPPPSSKEPPTIRRIVMGPDSSRGEVTQLFVPGGWWKASEIPEEDLLLLQAPDASGLEERIGCLISEVVVPGWTPEQHEWLDEAKLKEMWRGQPGWEQYRKYLNPPDGLEYPDKQE